jgi:hypothetical protein
MSTNLWFKDDIRNILASANASSAATALCAPSAAVLIYRRGYQAALMAVAMACGIPPEQVGVRLDPVSHDESPYSSEAVLEESGAPFNRSISKLLTG